jgi:hypothetical protein
MFKLPPTRNTSFLKIALLATLLYFIPSAKVFAANLVYSSALIDSIIDDQNLLAISDSKNWEIGEIVPIVSQNARTGTFAFAEVSSVRASRNKYDVRIKLLRQSRRYMIQKGDYIKRIDLSVYDSDYIGTTDLLIKQSQLNISSRYRPLVYQGVFIGETAQVLYKNELLVNVVGNIHYGATEWLSLSTFATFNVLGRPNASMKAKVYDSDSTTLSAGLSFVKLTKEDQSTLNLNLYWDSTSSDSLVAHTFLGLGLIQWDGAIDATAVKALGSSSFQTGYEIILSNWDRLLIGPNYNFEKKSLGGYLSYVLIYDRFHLQLALNATDISKYRYDTKDGYFLNFDIFWRF